MNTIQAASTGLLDSSVAARPLLNRPAESPDKTREAFDSFVGETFYGQMLKSLRKLNQKPPYFHGGQAEEIFRSQLDQTLAEQFTASTANSFTGPMFDLFQLQRKN